MQDDLGRDAPIPDLAGQSLYARTASLLRGQCGGTSLADFHGFAKPGQGGPGPALDRAKGQVQNHGDVSVAVAVVERELDEAALAVAEAAQGTAELLAFGHLLHHLVHVVLQRTGSRVPALAPGLGGDGPEPVDGATAGDQQRPGVTALLLAGS